MRPCVFLIKKFVYYVDNVLNNIASINIKDVKVFVNNMYNTDRCNF
jgi:hypothetical protein